MREELCHGRCAHDRGDYRNYCASCVPKIVNHAANDDAGLDDDDDAELAGMIIAFRILRNRTSRRSCAQQPPSELWTAAAIAAILDGEAALGRLDDNNVWLQLSSNLLLDSPFPAFIVHMFHLLHHDPSK